jgi:hypothetical protein
MRKIVSFILIVFLCSYIANIILSITLQKFYPQLVFDRNKKLIDYGEVVLAKFVKIPESNKIVQVYGVVIDPYDSNKGILVLECVEILISIPAAKMSILLKLKDGISKENPTCSAQSPKEVKSGNIFYMYIYETVRTYTIPIKEHDECIADTMISYHKLDDLIRGVITK